MSAREALGIMSQAELCRTLKIGKSEWNQFETGERKITTKVALKLKKEYGITLDWIYAADASALPFKLHQQLIDE